MEPTNKTNGLVIALIIVVILIIGAVYLWQQNVSVETEYDTSETILDQDSSDLNTLEQDLNSLDVNTGVDIEAVQ